MHQFKIGDRVRYNGENSVIVARTDNEYWIVTYTNGWRPSEGYLNIVEGAINIGTRYHYARENWIAPIKKKSVFKFN
jgi:hypothetical protein